MWTVRCSSVGNNVVFGFSKLFRGDICLCLLSAINLLSGMSLLSRYKPESCPALFCLIKSAALVEHMTDSCLVQLEQMTSLTCGISYCSYFTPSPHFFLNSIPLSLSVAHSCHVSFFFPLSLPCVKFFIHVKGLYNFWGVSCMAVGRKLLASFQTFHTKATVHM